MTEQQACTLCGAGGHLAARCNLNGPGTQAARDALQSIMEWTSAENIPADRKLCLIRNAARAALAQPSPAPELERPEGER